MFKQLYRFGVSEVGISTNKAEVSRSASMW
jgi:hypothetical protein